MVGRRCEVGAERKRPGHVAGTRSCIRCGGFADWRLSHSGSPIRDCASMGLDEADHWLSNQGEPGWQNVAVRRQWLSLLNAARLLTRDAERHHRQDYPFPPTHRRDAIVRLLSVPFRTSRPQYTQGGISLLIAGGYRLTRVMPWISFVTHRMWRSWRLHTSMVDTPIGLQGNYDGSLDLSLALGTQLNNASVEQAGSRVMFRFSASVFLLLVLATTPCRADCPDGVCEDGSILPGYGQRSMSESPTMLTRCEDCQSRACPSREDARTCLPLTLECKRICDTERPAEPRKTD